MARLEQRQAQLATTRKGPLAASLAALIEEAAGEADIDTVVCFSGGQPATGPNRVGSHRHDNGMAGDFWLVEGGKILDFTKPGERQAVARFITACAKRGATGIGADAGYMGPTKMHIGFGPKAVWGDAGHTRNADPWLVEAVRSGWDSPRAPVYPVLQRGDCSEEDEAEVKTLQRLLIAAGFDCGAVDGNFGERTEIAVIAFQTARHLEADARVGAKTWAALRGLAG